MLLEIRNLMIIFKITIIFINYQNKTILQINKLIQIISINIYITLR